MVTIRTYGSEFEAEAARAVLEASGIPAMVLRDNAGGMLPSLNLLSEVRLLVREEDADEADAVLSGTDGEAEE
jgi:hypothetical protein